MKLGSVAASQLELFRDTVINHAVNETAALPTALRIMDSFGVTDSYLAGIDNRWSIEKYLRLGKSVIDALALPNLGLKLGRHTKITHLGLLGLCCQAAPNVEVIAKLLVKYEPLVFDNIRGQSKYIVSTKNEPNTGNLLSFYSIAPYSKSNKFIVDSVLLGWQQIISYLTGRNDLFENVSFEFSAPSYHHEYLEEFTGGVNFNQANNSLQLKVNAEKTLNQYACRQTFAHMKQILDQTLKQKLAANDITIAVKQKISKLVATEKVRLALIASELQIPLWTLKRALASKGTSFQKLYGETRLQLANAYLTDGGFTIAQIGELTGFSSTAAFQHAYKRWTGKAPGAIRKKVGR